MAVLRPDQAQLTFAAEAGPGGHPETSDNFSFVSGGGSTSLTAEATAGSRTIEVLSSTAFTVGDQICIGYTTNTTDTLASARECRRIERISGTTAPITFTLDVPLGFHHPSGTSSHVKELNNWNIQNFNTPTEKHITWIPGVYETVDTPDPVMAIEPRYFLGTQAKRDFFRAYKGQQSFTGALNGIILLNGWPIRFPFGSVVTTANINPTETGSSIASNAGKPGDLYIQVSTTGPFTAGQTICIGTSVDPDTNQLKLSDTPEFRKVQSKTGAFLRLSAPLLYNHPVGKSVDNYGATHTAAGVANYIFYHHIVETIDLSSLSWHVAVQDSDETAANSFHRRYVGGKVGSASISAEEGGLVTMNWDNVVFMDMIHREATHNVTDTPTGGTHGSAALGVYAADLMPGYSPIHTILPPDVGPPGSYGPAASGFPTDEPYYFSQGTVKFWGQEFARIRSFNLTVNNNEDPRYYISGQYGRHRGPSEIREQRREYGMSCILALPDSSIYNGGDLAGATAMFRELLLEGQYDTSTMKGFKVELSFEKANGDAIKIFLPGLDPTTNTELTAALTEPAEDGELPRVLSSSGNQQGCFIRSAAHNITGEAPLQVDVEILFRNMHIIIKDGVAIYP